MSIKLTDTQLVVLSAAAQREDRCLVLPKGLKGGSAQKVSAKLLAEGLIREIRAKPGAPVWRRDEEADRSYALKLTAAAMKAITAQATATAEDADQPAPSSTAASSVSTADPSLAAEASPSLVATANPLAAATGISGIAEPKALGMLPREGTKMSGIVGLLLRDTGATLIELIAATDWLPHTVRAALTGLRKRGFVVTLDRSSTERGSIYAIPRERSAASEEAVAEPIELALAPTEHKKKPSRRVKSKREALAAIDSAA